MFFSWLDWCYGFRGISQRGHMPFHHITSTLYTINISSHHINVTYNQHNFTLKVDLDHVAKIVYQISPLQSNTHTCPFPDYSPGSQSLHAAKLLNGRISTSVIWNFSMWEVCLFSLSLLFSHLFVSVWAHIYLFFLEVLAETSNWLKYLLVPSVTWKQMPEVLISLQVSVSLRFHLTLLLFDLSCWMGSRQVVHLPLSFFIVAVCGCLPWFLTIFQLSFSVFMLILWAIQ